jgi:hypothetical protein
VDALCRTFYNHTTFTASVSYAASLSANLTAHWQLAVSV